MTNALFNGSTQDNGVDSELEDLKARFTRDGVLDAEALLAAKVAADKHIKNIESENAGMRDDLKSRTSLEDLVRQIKTVPNNADSEPQVGDPVTPPSADDWKNELKNEFSNYKRQIQSDNNVAYVQQELIKLWGPNYHDKLKARARELGESETDLGNLAAVKPKLFLELVGAKPTPAVSPYTAPASTYRAPSTPALPAGVKGKSYYTKLRKENPDLYWSVAMQKEIHQAAEAVGIEIWEKS